MNIVDKIKTVVDNARSISEQSVTSDLYTAANQAYRYHVRFFGQPEDAHWKYEIITAHKASNGRDPFRHMYIITVREQDPPQQRLASLAHEMYHRVTSRRKGRNGLHRHLWVDEMLASLTTHKFLCDHGQREYAQEIRKRCYAQPVRLDINTLKRLKRRPDFLGLLRSQYPPKFAGSIAVLGMTIEALVGWETMCSLVHCGSWHEWLDTLPDKTRKHVRELIEE